MNSILITGCNRGLGLGIVKCLVNLTKPPNYIFATCRDLNKAEELRALTTNHKNIHILELDISKTENHKEAVNEVKKIIGPSVGLNCLWNNAGVGGKSVRLGAVKEDDILETYRINTLIPVMLSKTFLPLIKLASKTNPNKPISVERAAIINMSSILGSIGLNTDGAMYSYRMSKSAINAATKSMSIDLRNDNILCVAIHPGWVKTTLGGPNAPLEIDTTCTELLKTIFSLNEYNNGTFIDYQGKELLW